MVMVSTHATNGQRQRAKSQLFIRMVLLMSISLICWLIFSEISSQEIPADLRAVVDVTGKLTPTPTPPDTPSHSLRIVSPSPSSRIWAVYICNDLEDDMQHKKMTELHDVFGDKLAVITDQRRSQVSQQFKKLPYSDRIVFDQAYTRKHLWNFKGYGLERAMMWLIANQAKFDHAWVIEEDVYWKSIHALQAFFKSYDNDDVDFLHQNMGMEEDRKILSKDSEEWNWNLYHLRRPHVQAEIGPPYYHGLFVFYRLSSGTAKKLNDWRLSNSGEWTFFEPLLSTLPVQDPDLTTKSFIDNSVGYEFHLVYRPCFTKEDIYSQSTIYPNGDCFHPVKKGFAACSA